MKKTLLLSLTLFVSIVMMATTITPDEARQRIARSASPRRAAIAQNVAALQLVTTSHFHADNDRMLPAYYIFNVGQRQGYIIAAADDRVPAVLGYSAQGSFDVHHIPANMKAWLEGYRRQMAYLDRHPEALAATGLVEGNTIAPLLGQTQWDQTAPYNYLCPMDSSAANGPARSVTGCVATAMAQIMYYWKHPRQVVSDIPAYTTTTRHFDMPGIAAGTAIDWDNIVPQYNGRQTEAQNLAVAQLMLICGTVCQMDYTPDFSGSYGDDATRGLVSYLGYDRASSYVLRGNYRLAPWVQKVYNELAAGRPVYYEGAASGGGHAFVIDGYGGDDYFHVNWGWGGYCDDYFLLSILDPGSNTGIGAAASSDGYSFDQHAIFGLQPDTGIAPTVNPVMSTSDARLVGGNTVTRTSSRQDFAFNVSFSYYNAMADVYTFDFAVGRYDTNGQLLDIVSQVNTVEDLQPGWGFYNTDKDILKWPVQFGRGITSGTYILKPVSRLRGTDTWHANAGSDMLNIQATIDNNTIHLLPPRFALSGTLKATGRQEAGAPCPLTATISNKGTLFNNEIFLLVDSVMVGGRHFDIDAGATDDVTFSFVPTDIGGHLVNLCVRSWNSTTYDYEYTAFISDSVFISAPSKANLAMMPTTKNAVSQNGNDVVSENRAVVSIRVINRDTKDYDNDIYVRYYRLVDETYGLYAGEANMSVQVPARETKTFELQLEGLEDRASYFYYVFYMSEGKLTQGYEFSPFFTVVLPDAIQTVDAGTARKPTVTHDLYGRRIDSTHARGLVIENNRKVIKK